MGRVIFAGPAAAVSATAPADEKISMTPAVELSYLKPEEQRNFLEAMDYAQAAPSVASCSQVRSLRLP